LCILKQNWKAAANSLLQIIQNRQRIRDTFTHVDFSVGVV